MKNTICIELKLKREFDEIMDRGRLHAMEQKIQRIINAIRSDLNSLNDVINKPGIILFRLCNIEENINLLRIATCILKEEKNTFEQKYGR